MNYSIVKSRLRLGEIFGLRPQVKSFASLTVKLNPSLHPRVSADFTPKGFHRPSGRFHPSARTDLVEKSSSNDEVFSGADIDNGLD